MPLTPHILGMVVLVIFILRVGSVLIPAIQLTRKKMIRVGRKCRMYNQMSDRF